MPEDEDTLQLIDEALHSADADDRASAVSDLGSAEPTTEVWLALLTTLRDSDEEVRLETILALESLENPAAIPVLKRIAAEDRSEEVREAAAEALDYLVNPLRLFPHDCVRAWDRP